MIIFLIGIAIIVAIYLIVSNTSATARSVAQANQMAFDAMPPEQQDRVIEAESQRAAHRRNVAIVIVVVLIAALWLFGQ